MQCIPKKILAAQRRKLLRDRAIAYLGGRCRICSYDRCPSAFDFHHLDPMEKDFTISAAMTSWARIKPELDKCVLLCSNCHREVHDGMHPIYLVLEDAYRGDYWDDELDELDFPESASPEALAEQTTEGSEQQP